MVVINKLTIIIILFLFIGCKDSEKNKLQKINKIDPDSLIIYRKRNFDSIELIKKNKEEYPITISKNKKFLELLVVEKNSQVAQNDFNNIESVLLKTPSEIDFTYLHSKTNKNGIIFQNFGLANYLEYKKPYKEFSPFINQKTKQIDFIISYDESTVIPLKISFKKDQYFWFGKSFKWITPKIKIKDTFLADYQDYNKNSFSNENNQDMISGGSIFEFNKKKYLLFTFWNGMWCIHHLFDVTNEKKIKYFILNGIYTDEDGYGDFNNDGKLDFKQKYFYLRNSMDHSKDRFKIYTIEL